MNDDVFTPPVRVTVLGLGAMGQRMARRLLAAGHQLTVYNRSPGPAEALAKAGATVAPTPRAAAEGAQVVMAMVTDDAAARAVWLDPEHGAALGLSAHAVAVESSTVSPAFIDELTQAVASRQAALLDAPVAGSRPQAEAGQLIHLVGGDAAALERVRPLLSALGGAVHHVGPQGAGARMKLAVNVLFGVQVALVAELLDALRRGGIEPSAAMEVLGALPVTSPAAKGVGGLMVAGRFDPMFPIDLVEKDFRYAVQTAQADGGEAPLTEAARLRYAAAQRAGHGGLNIAGVAKLFGFTSPS